MTWREISNVGPEGMDLYRGSRSDVFFNPAENEYLVTWEGGHLSTPDTIEISGQRVSADGTQVGQDFQISQVTVSGTANAPALAYHPVANQYLVTWTADTASSGEEIFGQRLSAGVAEIGENDFRISTTGTDGDTLRRAFDPAVAYTPIGNEYVVAWYGDGLATDNETEIFGQRLSAAGADVGTDFRISNVGADGNDARDGTAPAIAYNAAADEFLVAFVGDGLATNDEFEIFGHRLALPFAPPPESEPGDLGDTTPPDTKITKGAPNKTDKTKVKFKFTSSEPDSTFECKLDKKPYKLCTSPKMVKRLDEHKHKFKVRAIDAAGNVDSSPAKDKFKVVGE